ncbi:hypothetical protein F2P56_003851 [Juglans regia]|uniref:Transcription factor TCP17 n=2 Tax=Juglans regia TaxID=51240 RepID=A0A2I4EZK0_JUGRE|nr:transcription factor TCP17 [Juglans regia]XP_018824825.1 transcription factor TCP17 [Juglans regia]KAF5477181.1 hypothetical protein F2P56_003851 [Juglans regia]
MITKSRDKDVQAKQESPTDYRKCTSSRQWSGSRNPRIVRVSRSFGGKDRHSKVCTIRGLRDRRIRLSVPTAIQLYDLQERLGLSQPSKAIDWLLDATKHDIDQLPPLPIHQGFGQFHEQFSHEPNTSDQYSSVISSFDANAAFIKEVADKGKWVKTNEEDQIQYGIGGQNPAQKLFPTLNHSYSSSLPGLQNNAMAYNSYYNSEPSALSLSQFGSHGLSPSHIDHHSLTSNAIPVQLSSGSQYFFYPSSTTLPAVFTPYPSYFSTLIESDPRQINHIQLSSSSSQHVLPHHPGLIPSLHSVGSPLKSFAANDQNPKLIPQSHPNNDQNKLEQS